MSHENVICFPGVTALPEAGEASKDLVEMLTDLLQHAKDGELTAFYGIFFDGEGHHVRVMAGGHPLPFEVVGALEAYKSAYIQTALIP